MKLAQKIYFYLGCIFIVAMTIFGIFSYQREALELEASTIRDVLILGRGFASAVSNIWQSSGEEQALKIVRDANSNAKYGIRVRWVWLDDTPLPQYHPQVNIRHLRGLRFRGFLIKRGYRLDGVETLFAYFPVQTGPMQIGALELSEPLIYLHRQSRVNALRLSLAALLLLGAVGIMMWYVGRSMVGCRMQKLVDFSRQIGRGNLENRLHLSGADEISELCREMNQMAEQLHQAKQELLAENEARIATLEQLRHTDRLATLGKLSSGMAHELGTPLNVVSGRAKLIEDEDMSREETKENAMIIRQQAERMTTIMRQVLDYARRTTPHRTKVNIRPLVEQVIIMLGHQAQKQGVEINLTGLDKLPDIAIDYGQIQQVLTNLLMNGLQAMPHGGGLTITLSVAICSPPDSANYQPAAYVIVEIKDSGPGIAPDLLPQIFEPFFTTKGVGQGTGLGLSIAKEIVQEHRGWISVESGEGQGASFTVHLPVENYNG